VPEPEKFRETKVDVRNNILSAALWPGLSLNDAGLLDLAYASAVGGSWVLIHIAAQKLLRQI